MIIYIAAARAVGIPARPASVPFWNFTDNNHAWVEVWTPSGWKYLGEAENALNRAWFSKTTERATLITAHAIGNFRNPNTIKQENNVTSISSIEYYTTAKDCNILVLDEQYLPIFEADVYLYAVSYGGLFAMTKLKPTATDVFLFLSETARFLYLLIKKENLELPSSPFWKLIH